MTIAQAFNEITLAQGGTPNAGGTIAGAIDALNDTLAGSDQQPAQTIEGAIRLLGAHIGGGVAPSGTIEITENGEGIDVAQYAYADVNVSGGGSTAYKVYIFAQDYSNLKFVYGSGDGVAVETDDLVDATLTIEGNDYPVKAFPEDIPAGEIIRNMTVGISCALSLLDDNYDVATMTVSQYFAMPRCDTVLNIIPSN